MIPADGIPLFPKVLTRIPASRPTDLNYHPQNYRLQQEAVPDLLYDNLAGHPEEWLF